MRGGRLARWEILCGDVVLLPAVSSSKLRARHGELVGQTANVNVRVRRRPGRPSGGRQVVDREHVLDAAERAIRREGANVSMETIAAEAGVTKPIVYARVGGRTELANALSSRLNHRLVANTGVAIDKLSYGKDMVAAFIASNLSTVADHRELFLFVTGGTADDTPERRLYLAEQSTSAMAELLVRWRTRQGLDPAVATPWAYAMIGMLHLVSLWWISDPDRSADELAAHLAELLWNGLSGTQPIDRASK